MCTRISRRAPRDPCRRSPMDSEAGKDTVTRFVRDQ
jgi:hypothetical protein